MSAKAEVVIVGGGPVGLMLACELKLAGAEPVLLERLAEPTGLSKALGTQGAGVSLLELRGLLPRFGRNAPITGPAHFGGVRLSVDDLGEPRPRFLFAPQADLEAVLEARALELGVDLRRGVELLDFVVNADGVRAHFQTTRGPESIEARFLVGADGAHSLVRRQAEIDFPGEPPQNVLRLGDVKLKGDVTTGPTGLVIDGTPAPFRYAIPLDHGYFRVVTREPLPEGFDRSKPPTLAELNDSLARAFGPVTELSEARWLSVFTDASRQAAQYRKGNVFVVGDAAHVHLPAGGPGLSTGLGDAVNLGWKLARVVRGLAPDALLDTYHAERHPVGERVLLQTRAQSALLATTPNVMALKAILGEVFSDPSASRRLMNLLQGADVRYDFGTPSAAPAVGMFAPQFTVKTEQGDRTLFELLRPPRGLLLAADGTLPAPELRDLVDVVKVPSGPSWLVRPDGFVAWEGPGPGLDAAVQRWFAA